MTNLFEIVFFNNYEKRQNSIVVSASNKYDAKNNFQLKYPYYNLISVVKL